MYAFGWTVFSSTSVLNSGSGNGVGVMVGGKAVGLAVKVAVGEGGTRVVVDVRVGADVCVA